MEIIAKIKKNIPAVLFIAYLLIAPNLYAQNIAIKSNLLYDLTSSLNIGGELRCDDTHTFNLSINYNPWSFNDNRKMKHFLLQPEYRKWFSEAFVGSFIGIQAHYAQFNFGGMLPENRLLANNRFQGNLIGLGLSYGYQWMISPQWNLEASVALGYAHLTYKCYGQAKGAALIEKAQTNYWGPMQIGLSLVYFIQ